MRINNLVIFTSICARGKSIRILLWSSSGPPPSAARSACQNSMVNIYVVQNARCICAQRLVQFSWRDHSYVPFPPWLCHILFLGPPLRAWWVLPMPRLREVVCTHRRWSRQPSRAQHWDKCCQSWSIFFPSRCRPFTTASSELVNTIHLEWCRAENQHNEVLPCRMICKSLASSGWSNDPLEIMEETENGGSQEVGKNMVAGGSAESGRAGLWVTEGKAEYMTLINPLIKDDQWSVHHSIVRGTDLVAPQLVSMQPYQAIPEGDSLEMLQ